MERYCFSKEVLAAYEGMQQPFAIYQFIDKRVVTLVLSDGFCELFGYDDRAQAYYDMDHNMYQDTHPDDAGRIAEEALRFAAEDDGTYEVIYRTRSHSSSEYKIIHAFGKHVYTDTNVRLAHVWYTDEGLYSEEPDNNQSDLNNILRNVLHEESILTESHYDYLTGLPSMVYFFELAEAAKAVYSKKTEQIAFLYFDLNGMKFYNNKYGFAEGDKLLKSFSKLLVHTFSNENCCHIGGDHFAVFTKEAGVEDILKKLFAEWSEGAVTQALPIRVGIYLNRLEDVHVSTACDRAKTACDSLRNTFSSGFSYYNQDIREDLESRQFVLTRFEQALKERWIQVYYQPIVRTLNGRVCDEEALARWIDPVKGFLSPAEFIPYLEDAGEIYKLDLYVLDRILEKFKDLEEKGLFVVPQSLNLSRSDFDACDIVEEIRKRVDDAGISRNRITIEITESTIGSNFDFMKKQVERFQKLGFPVWMDDFGSGYSSLDVLQTIKFNLIKFDMSFMQKLDEGTNGKIVLTELMRMATALHVDSVCEGVETEEQARFLREIGCAKLQGFYYSKPIPVETILERFYAGTLIGFENPDETAYYEKIGRVNLYDLSVINYDELDEFQNFFNVLPMTIMEIKDDKVWFVHGNQSYRDFMKRYFEYDLSQEETNSSLRHDPQGSEFMDMVRESCKKGSSAFFDHQMSDGTVVHSFARRLTTNPVTGRTAVAIAVLSITDAKKEMTFDKIAKAMTADFYRLYYVDLETDTYTDYSVPTGGHTLSMERHGDNYFETARIYLREHVNENDRASVLKSFTKENIIKELNEVGSFKMSLRLIKDGQSFYAGLKTMRMNQDDRHIILGISRIDSPMKRNEEANELWKDMDTFARMMALVDDYLSIYIIEPDTGHYRELSSTDSYRTLGFEKEGEDFFEQGVEDGYKTVCPDDLEQYLREFSREDIMKKVRGGNAHVQNYRLMINGEPKPVTLKIALVKETDGERLIAGVRTRKESSADF